MEENDSKTIRTQAEIATDQSGSKPAGLSKTPSPAPPEKAKTWSILAPIAFNESEDPWRKINDQTVPMTDDNTSAALHIPSDMFLG